MPRALILGGTGAIGRATAGRLLDAGWDVDVTGRDPRDSRPSWQTRERRFIASDRGDAAQLHNAFGSGADLLVDCVCFTADDARRLLPFVSDAGSAVMISSKAVYVDDEGRHSNSDSAPIFGGPISEAQPTVAAGDMDYNVPRGLRRQQGRCGAVLLDSGSPVTVLRPSKIHGAGAARPREWMFVKRALDRPHGGLPRQSRGRHRSSVRGRQHRGADRDRCRTSRGRESSTAPIPMRRARSRSRARSRATSVTSGKRSCSPDGADDRLGAHSRGTRRTRSSST